MRDKTKPQDDYCKGCYHYERGACNVTLRDDEDECEDRLEFACPECGSANFRLLTDEDGFWNEGEKEIEICCDCGAEIL